MKQFFSQKTFRGILVLLFLMLFLVSGHLGYYQIAYSDELDDLNKQIQELQSALTASQNATKPLEGQLTNLKKQLDNIDYQVSLIEANIIQRRAEIEKGYENLSENQKLFNSSVRNSYINSYGFTPLLIFLSGDDAGNVSKLLTYHERYTRRDKETITNIALQIVDLEEKKERLESEQVRLASAMQTLDTQRAEVQKVVDEAKGYQEVLSVQIAELRRQQEEILSKRLGSLNLPQSLGAGPLACVDDRDAKYNPGFSPAFAFFTFGIPHRVGLNQYGAWGRAKSGQSHEQILQAYFQNFEFQSGKENENVVVNGTNEFNQSFNNETMNIEEYLKHLHEMPTSWTENDSAALKAQAISARSYALRVMQEKGFLYPSQSDQVIKRELNNQTWINAVEATRGTIMASGGQPIKAWYASTAGGYTFTSQDVWGGVTSWTKRLRDTSGDVGSFQDLFNNSYDKDSPCAYAAQGSRSQYSNSAWLKGEEIADIANSLMLAKACPECGNHLYQTDKPHPFGGEIWDEGRVRQELLNRNKTPFTSVSDVSVPGVDWSLGESTTIRISGSTTEEFNANEFRKTFNLRAPANIQIVGPLFNVEKK